MASTLPRAAASCLPKIARVCKCSLHSSSRRSRAVVNGLATDSLRRAAAELRDPDAHGAEVSFRPARQGRGDRLLGDVVPRLHRRVARLRARAADVRRPRRGRHDLQRDRPTSRRATCGIGTSRCRWSKISTDRSSQSYSVSKIPVTLVLDPAGNVVVRLGRRA